MYSTSKLLQSLTRKNHSHEEVEKHELFCSNEISDEFRRGYTISTGGGAPGGRWEMGRHDDDDGEAEPPWGLFSVFAAASPGQRCRPYGGQLIQTERSKTK